MNAEEILTLALRGGLVGAVFGLFLYAVARLR